MPKILFVAMTESVHTARWLRELENTGWDIHIFPSQEYNIHPQLLNATVHGFYFNPGDAGKNLNFQGTLPNPFPFKGVNLNSTMEILIKKIGSKRNSNEYFHARKLVKVIKKIKPDVIHSLEMQHSGYLTLKAKELMGSSFPIWMYTPWGNDIFFFGRLPEHRELVNEVLASCDYYCPKSKRDIRLAIEYGFKNEMLQTLPGNGGYDTTECRSYWSPGLTSNRKLILIKGYQGTMGRALFALRAVELCAESLKDYSISIYSATDDVKIKANLMSDDLGIPITIIPQCNHEKMLKLFGQARLSIAMSLSDGVSNSLLESMVMGTFPIESNTSCADEWITEGRDGYIVPPEDPKTLADAIRHALSDDQMVNHAAEKNFQTIRDTMDRKILRPKIISLYQGIFDKMLH